MDIYEQQARWFRNIPLIDPRFRASVHIEDKEDEKFWDYHLQHIAPARYKYISHSKNGSGKEITGCECCAVEDKSLFIHKYSMPIILRKGTLRLLT